MPSLSLNVGLNNGRKLPFGGGAAPSGIPVASTTMVAVSGSPDGFNGTYLKFTATQWKPASGDNKLLWDSIDAAIPNRWSLYNSDTNFIVTHQTWSDQTQIPMSGWPNGETIVAVI